MNLFKLPLNIRLIIWKHTKSDLERYQLENAKAKLICQINTVGKHIIKLERKFSFCTSANLFLIPKRSKLPYKQLSYRHEAKN